MCPLSRNLKEEKASALWVLVLVISCCITSYPQTLWLKTTGIYYPTVSRDQELGSGSARGSGSEFLKVAKVVGWAEVL